MMNFVIDSNFELLLVTNPHQKFKFNEQEPIAQLSEFKCIYCLDKSVTDGSGPTIVSYFSTYNGQTQSKFSEDD